MLLRPSDQPLIFAIPHRMTQDFLPGGGVVRPASETSGNGPLSFRRNEPTFPQRLPIRPAPPVVWHQSNCPLPYFAHQTLDLKYFPAGKSTLPEQQGRQTESNPPQTLLNLSVVQ